MEKDKLKMDEWESPDRRPCFYRIIWLPNLTELKIPSAFKKHLSNKQTNSATLRSPCGNWKVKLLQEGSEIYFGQGWQEFVKDHSLGKFEYLLFKYNEEMSFDVVIFDKNGCKKSYQESPSTFISSFPFFKHRINNCNVGRKCSLQIPQAFSKMHLSSIKQTMILQNSKGIPWLVNVIINSNKQLLISGGWKAFADDNSIKKGNVCIFELVEQNKMQVHVFSA
ncbi:hypothetical protein CDL12_18743 [Handroanthus impetiginosus]|uniref:TF-B3 domain-containing protein n=1 Tax=Handroanthus impetiginosus TaxID=429701 RepID=A0A2G9GTT7_9LAMI|nr:hypothetical protein CDL12_18743 [Handroanthus impetiginosus]